MNCIVLRLAILLSLISGLGLAQDVPTVLVVPSEATMLVGDTRTFRAVGKDGRILHGVQWSISSDDAAKLTTNDDEAVVNAVEPSASIVLTAHANGESAEASIEIRSGAGLSAGTKIWSVTPLPGCKSVNITQAVPTANGPDLYDEEACQQGSFIRAMTADGREIWRRKMGELVGTQPTSIKPAENPQPQAEHLNWNNRSICDSITVGMPKDQILKLAQSSRIPVSEKAPSDSWVFEEPGFTCKLFFDKAGAVSKKRKSLVTE